MIPHYLLSPALNWLPWKKPTLHEPGLNAHYFSIMSRVFWKTTTNLVLTFTFLSIMSSFLIKANSKQSPWIIPLAEKRAMWVQRSWLQADIQVPNDLLALPVVLLSLMMRWVRLSTSACPPSKAPKAPKALNIIGLCTLFQSIEERLLTRKKQGCTVPKKPSQTILAE